MMGKEYKFFVMGIEMRVNEDIKQRNCRKNFKVAFNKGLLASRLGCKNDEKQTASY